MREEAFVLGREYRVHHHLRNVVELHDPALLALAIKQVGDQLGL